jgi:hypothetical protein
MTDRDIANCHGCGRPTHLHLLDAKPDNPRRPDSCDWNRLECEDCYGPGWLPCGEEHALPNSPERLATARARGLA